MFVLRAGHYLDLPLGNTKPDGTDGEITKDSLHIRTNEDSILGVELRDENRTVRVTAKGPAGVAEVAITAKADLGRTRHVKVSPTETLHDQPEGIVDVTQRLAFVVVPPSANVFGVAIGTPVKIS